MSPGTMAPCGRPCPPPPGRLHQNISLRASARTMSNASLERRFTCLSCSTEHRAHSDRLTGGTTPLLVPQHSSKLWDQRGFEVWRDRSVPRCLYCESFPHSCLLTHPAAILSKHMWPDSSPDTVCTQVSQPSPKTRAESVVRRGGKEC